MQKNTKSGITTTIAQSISLLMDSNEERYHHESKILIIEDDPKTTEKYVSLLISTGFLPENIINLDSGERVLKEFEEGSLHKARFNIIVLDEHLAGDLSGTEVASKLKDKGFLMPYTKVISLSAYLRRDEAREKANFLSAILEKPFSEKDLIATIEEQALNSFYIKKEIDAAIIAINKKTPQSHNLFTKPVDPLSDSIILKQYEDICQVICQARVNVYTKEEAKEVESLKFALLSSVKDLFKHTKVIGNEKHRYSIAYLTLLYAFTRIPSKFRLQHILNLIQDSLSFSEDCIDETIGLTVSKVTKRLNYFNTTMDRKAIDAFKISCELRSLFFMRSSLLKDFIKTMRNSPYYLLTEFGDDKEALRIPCKELNLFLPNYISHNFWALNEPFYE